MTTYTLECDGITKSGLVGVAAVQAVVDRLKTESYYIGREVRVYRFVNGCRMGGKPDLTVVITNA